MDFGGLVPPRINDYALYQIVKFPHLLKLEIEKKRRLVKQASGIMAVGADNNNEEEIKKLQERIAILEHELVITRRKA